MDEEAILCQARNKENSAPNLLSQGTKLFSKNGEVWDEEEDESKEETFRQTIPENRRQARWAELIHLYCAMKRQEALGHTCTLEKALFAMTGRVISLAAFVSAMMGACRFETRAKMDLHLSRLYRTFDRSDEDKADVREIIGSLYIFIYHRLIRSRSHTVVSYLFDLFCDNEDPLYCISRKDLFTMFLIPVVSEDEAIEISNILTRKVPLRRRFSRQCFAGLLQWEKDELLDSDEDLPPLATWERRLLEAFKSCAWRRIGSELRLSVLHQAEDDIAYACEKIIEDHMNYLALRFRVRFVYRFLMERWKAFRDFSVMMRTFRERVMYKRIKRAVKWWHEYLELVKFERLQYIASTTLKEAHIKKRVFHRLQRFYLSNRAAKGWEHRHNPIYRVVVDGCKHLRFVQRRKRLRRGFMIWWTKAWYLAAAAQAEKHYIYQLRKRVFVAYRAAVRCIVAEKEKLANEASDRKTALRVLNEAMTQANEALRLAQEQEQKEEERKRQEALEERLREKFWITQRAISSRKAEDRLRLQIQDKARKKRVAEEKEEMKRAFHKEYDRRFIDDVETAKEKVELAFDAAHQPTPLYKDYVQAELKLLKEKFYRPPTHDNMEEERAMKDLANIVFVYLEAVLNVKRIVLKDLFKEYNKSGSGFLSHGEFTSFMRSLPLDLTGAKIRDIIHKVDSDGDGYVNFSELQEAMQAASNTLGIPGSPWKMYIDPAQSVMVYHDIRTDEKVFDYRMTENKLMEILHENLRASEGVKVFNALLKKREEDWEHLQRDYAARVIQKQGRIYLARRERNRIGWKAGLVIQAEKDETRAAASQVIRKAVLSFLARRELYFLALISIEKVYDLSSGLPYYYSHASGLSYWKKPQILKKDFSTIPWSIQISNGRPQYYNSESGITQKERPDGVHSCGHCRLQLGIRRCTCCNDLPLCFSCYRRQHWIFPSIRCSRGDHDGIPLQVVPCSMCGKADSNRYCNECEKDLCKSCFTRIHRSPLMAVHTWKKY